MPDSFVVVGQSTAYTLPVRLIDTGDTTDGGDAIYRLGTTADDVALAADARNGALASIEVTLSATPGTVTSVTIPDDARGVRLYPRSNAIRFAVGEDPAAVATSSSTTIPASTLAVGGIAKADQWEVRLLESGTSRTVRLRSATASVVVDMEVF
jgi:hypothetical protein